MAAVEEVKTSSAKPDAAGWNRAWAGVAVLTVVSAFNYVDRLLPSLLAEPIKHELRLSDTAVGLINGFGFLILYAVLGVPIARAADRGRYGLVIKVCMTLWSAMTMLGSFAQTGLQLAATRLGVAAGEAGCTPTAHAYISRHFPPDGRARPIAVLTIAGPLSHIAALAGGGLLGQTIGWRHTFLLVGALNLLLLPLLAAVMRASPAAEAIAEAAPAATRRSALTLLRQPSYLLIVAACGFMGAAGYTMNTFALAFLMRVHGLSLAEAGVKYGVLNGLTGILGLWLSATVIDRLSRKDPRAGLWLMCGLLLAGLPISVLAVSVGSPTAAFVLLALSFLPVAVYLVPAITAIQRITAVDMRATASAVLLFCAAVVGGVGPFLTGLISDALEPRYGVHSLGYGLLTYPGALICAAILYFLATRGYAREIVEA
jgi:predicted MFS family arabinose efflux permease